MGKKLNTEKYHGEIAEIGTISFDLEGSDQRRASGTGLLLIKNTFGILTLLLKTDMGEYIIIPDKNEMWGNKYNPYVKYGYSCFFLNIPNSL